MQGPKCRVSEEEVAKALRKMKHRKAGGPFGVVAEIASELDSESGRKSVFRLAKQISKEQQDVQGSFCLKNE